MNELITLKKELLMWNDYEKHLKNKTYHRKKTDKEAVSLAETESIITDLVNKIQEKIAECMRFIETIEKSDIRQAIFYRYVDGKNYIQIAIKLDTTEDAIRVKVKRYLREHEIEIR